VKIYLNVRLKKLQCQL